MLQREEIEQVARIIGDRNIMVLSDEIYSRLQFEGEPFSIMSLPGMQERTILLDGFSKTYAMTGWRIGYGVMRADLAAQMTRLMTNSNSCTASFTQMAGIEALRGDQSPVDRMRAEFKRRSELFVAGLNRDQRLQSCRMPKGAFYVFPNITATGWKSKPLADALLEQTGVAALSGTAFGQLRRRLSALQRGQFAGEPGRSARAYRPAGRRRTSSRIRFKNRACRLVPRPVHISFASTDASLLPRAGEVHGAYRFEHGKNHPELFH